MPFTTLISASELNSHLNDPDWAIVDCRFSLDNEERGHSDYLISHISGAIYAHLDNDLSAPKIPGKTGRHPLPEIPAITETLSTWGIDNRTQVVVYDDATGSMGVRLWWLLNWLGHTRVAMLNGGWMEWQQSGLSPRSGAERRLRRQFEPHEVQGIWVSANQVEEYRNNPQFILLDARSSARFRGDVEPIDPVAGHIPGAVSAPWEHNITPDGKFLSPEALRQRFGNLAKTIPTENVICYCGSGVTAAHNIFSIAYAGLGMGRLYAGSWSEWITDPSRPIATGDT